MSESRTSGTNRAGDLTVSFVDVVQVLTPDDELRFGRSADLVLDENPYMHRVVGRFVHREGVWWLQNHGSKTRLEKHDLDRGTVLEAAPGQQVPVLEQSFVVRFTAGPTTYELHGTYEGAALALDAEGDVIGTATIDFATVPLSAEQHLLIVALYESRTRLGMIEGNSVLAQRLGWSRTKFNRKLDAVCDKLSRAGVGGLKGHPGELAEGRRDALVAHGVRAGLVGPNDLPLLHGDR